MRRLFYCSPRAFLIQCLNDPTKNNIVSWIEEGKSFDLVDSDKFFNVLIKEWGRCAIMDSGIEEWSEEWESVYSDVFYDCLGATLNGWGFFREEKNCNRTETITTRSTDEVFNVTDTAGPLYESIIKYLLEYMNTDFLEWVDREKLEFRVLDTVGFGKRYCKVNDIRTTNPSHMIRLMLSGYCSTGILKKIDKLRYQFNSEWYQKEVKKENNEMWWPYVDSRGDLTPTIAIFHGAIRRNALSQIHFPEITRSNVMETMRFREWFDPAQQLYGMHPY